MGVDCTPPLSSCLPSSSSFYSLIGIPVLNPDPRFGRGCNLSSQPTIGPLLSIGNTTFSVSSELVLDANGKLQNCTILEIIFDNPPGGGITIYGYKGSGFYSLGTAGFSNSGCSDLIKNGGEPFASMYLFPPSGDGFPRWTSILFPTEYLSLTPMLAITDQERCTEAGCRISEIAGNIIDGSLVVGVDTTSYPQVLCPCIPDSFDDGEIICESCDEYGKNCEPTPPSPTGSFHYSVSLRFLATPCGSMTCEECHRLWGGSLCDALPICQSP